MTHPTWVQVSPESGGPARQEQASWVGARQVGGMTGEGPGRPRWQGHCRGHLGPRSGGSTVSELVQDVPGSAEGQGNGEGKAWHPGAVCTSGAWHGLSGSF